MMFLTGSYGAGIPLIKLPTNGSKTGTLTAQFTVSITSKTEAAGALTVGTGAQTSGTFTTSAPVNETTSSITINITGISSTTTTIA